MEHYKLKVGIYDGIDNIEVDIPENIKFFYNPGTVGNLLCPDCEHYTTIVEEENYSEWVEYISDLSLNIDCDKIGKYAIITITNLHKDTPIPTVDRDTWFKENNIDFGQYILVTYNKRLEPINAYKIVEFHDIWNIDVIIVTFIDYFALNEYFSISKNSVKLVNIEPSPCSSLYLHLEIYGGDKANIMWNSMLLRVIGEFNFNPEYANESYDFLEYQKQTLEKIGFDSMEKFEEFMEGKENDLEYKNK